MWFFGKGKCKTKDNADKINWEQKVDKKQVKDLCEEWEKMSSKLQILEKAYEVHQQGYQIALQTLFAQEVELIEASLKFYTIKTQLLEYLKNPMFIDINAFKKMSDECMNAHKYHDERTQKMYETEKEFSNVYSDWEEKFSSYVNKINETKEKIREIETQIQELYK
jgi:molecular chaperone DnaK (HSP70)